MIEQLRAAPVGSTEQAPVYVLPDLPVLSALTIDELVNALGATVLAGSGAAMHREVEAYLAGSGYIQNLLPRLLQRHVAGRVGRPRRPRCRDERSGAESFVPDAVWHRPYLRTQARPTRRSRCSSRRESRWLRSRWTHMRRCTRWKAYAARFGRAVGERSRPRSGSSRARWTRRSSPLEYGSPALMSSRL